MDDPITGLYDAPPVVVILSGGVRDGERLAMGGDPPFTLRLPDPPSATMLIADPGPYYEPPVSRYEFTGSITDDGVRVYRLARR